MDGPAARHAVRATREAGRRTRSALLDAASALFAERGLNGVSITDIVAAADCFPSQVTYYFGSKEALFVEAACRGALHLASRIEEAARAAGTPQQYVRGMVRVALADPTLATFVEAMLLARHRRDLAPLVVRTFERLHGEGERAAAEIRALRGWRLRILPADEARGFYSILLGVALEQSATGEGFEQDTAEAAVLMMLNLHPGPDMERT